MEQHLARDPQNVKMYSDIITEQEKQVLTDPETTVGTCHSPTPCFVKGICKPPQYSSCKTAAVDNPKNTLALMTVCYQGHLFLMT